MEKIIIDEDKTIRLDSYLSETLDISRNKVSSLIKNDLVLVNDKSTKGSYLLKSGDTVTISDIEEEDMNVEPENIPLDIVYEDEDLLVINKQNGLVVHPAPGNTKGTLVNALLYHSKKLSSINGSFRPGIVHRIDAYTTGLLLVAKTDKAHEFLAKDIEAKKTKRKYIALVWGVIKEDTATIDAPIGRDLTDRKKMAVTNINSKDSITHFRVLERYKNSTLIELTLETGRTHQIRVHMDYIGHPVVNDPVYGKRKKIDESGQCLHAFQIEFIHPRTKEKMKFECGLPECFINIQKKFKEDRFE